MQKTGNRFDPWVRKIPLEQEMATHSSIFTWKIPWTEAWQAPVHGVAESDTTECVFGIGTEEHLLHGFMLLFD